MSDCRGHNAKQKTLNDYLWSDADVCVYVVNGRVLSTQRSVYVCHLSFLMKTVDLWQDEIAEKRQVCWGT